MKKLDWDYQTSTLYLIISILFQTGISLYINIVNYLTLNGYFNMVIPPAYNILVIITACISLWSISSIYRLTKSKEQAEIAAVKLQESQEVVMALRTQRHDFANHLQVIQGLLQLEKDDRALEYIAKLTERNELISISLNLNVPEATATIMKKLLLAEEKSIHTDVEILSPLDELKMNGIDIASLLSNLLDNAIDALCSSPESNRVLGICTDETDDHYILEVSNSHPVIPPALRERIFEKGFSTKSSSGRGLGLSIVKNLVEKYDGILELDSREGLGTVFTISLPKK